MEARELLEDECDMVEGEGLALVEHVEGAAVAILDVFEHDDAILGAFAGKPAEPGKGPRATKVEIQNMRTFRQ